MSNSVFTFTEYLNVVIITANPLAFAKVFTIYSAR